MEHVLNGLIEDLIHIAAYHYLSTLKIKAFFKDFSISLKRRKKIISHDLLSMDYKQRDHIHLIYHMLCVEVYVWRNKSSEESVLWKNRSAKSWLCGRLCGVMVVLKDGCEEGYKRVKWISMKVMWDGLCAERKVCKVQNYF